MTEKKYIGAVFFDIDGTLVDERVGITMPTDKTKEAIQALKEKGYLVGTATGRSKCYMRDFGIDFDCYITCNGAVAEVDKEVIFNDCIEEEKLKELVEFLDNNDFAYDIETLDACYYGKKRKDLLFRFLDIFNVPTEHFKPLEELSGVKANKVVMAFEDAGQFENLKRLFKDDFFVTRHHDYTSGDVGKLGISKATGIKKVISHFNIDIENTYAFGDDENDVEMLSSVGIGIGMTPHSPLIEKVAKRFTSGVAEEGVYKGLTELGII